MAVRFFMLSETARLLAAGQHPARANIKQDEDGHYIALNVDPTDPTSDPGDKISPKHVLLVTWRETVYAGFRPDGFYETPNANLQIRTNFEKSQTYQAFARSYGDLKDIALKVRCGKLQPRYDFTAEAAPETEPMVIETNTSLLPNPERIEHTGVKLRELLESARRCKMQDISHSITWVTDHWHVVVAGFAPKLTGPNFN